METKRQKSKQEIQSDIRMLKEFEMSLEIMRDAIEMGRFDNEDLYPMDTFKYNPECISDLLKETRDSIKLLNN